MPGDGEHHAAVAGVRHHDGVIARQKLAGKHQVNALAGGDHRFRLRIRHATDVVGEGSGGVDDDLGVDLELAAAFEIDHRSTGQLAVGGLQQALDADIIYESRSLFGCSLGEVDQQAGIVELTVVIDDAAAQAIGLDGGQALEGFGARKDAGGSKTVLAREQIVDLQSGTIEGRFPPLITGHDKRQIMDEVRRILPHQSALLERFHDQRNVALLKIADASVGELGAAAGCPFAEVGLLDEGDVVAARGSVHGDADSGCASADDEHVPWFAPVVQAGDHFTACHDGRPLRLHSLEVSVHLLTRVARKYFLRSLGRGQRLRLQRSRKSASRRRLRLRR